MTPAEIKKLPLTTLSRRTLSILVEDDQAGRVKMVRYFTQNNLPVYQKLLSVYERIPDLVDKVGIKDIAALIMAEITKFVNSYTVVRPMSADQIASCASALILTSDEDRLSLEDLVVFFEGAKQGKYGRILDHIDQHVIFEMLDVYREERHRTVRNIREEEHIKFKGLGDNTRSSESDQSREEDIRSAMVEYKKKEWAK